MSRVLARNMFKKNAPKRSAKGVGITSMLEDDVPGYAEVEVDDKTERERLARMLLEQGKDEGEMYQRFSEQERPRMYRPPATMGMMPPQPNPQQMQAAQMQQMAQMGMLPRFQEGGFVQSQPLSGWGSRISGWASSIPGWSQSNPLTSAPGMSNPEMQAPPSATELPATTPQQDSLAARLAARRSAEQQRMAADEEAIQKRNMAQDDVIRSPEGQEAMDLMTQGRILNDPALYQKGRDALKALTDKAYETRGATTGPFLPGGSTPPGPEPRYEPSPESGSPAGDTGGIMGGRVAQAAKRNLPPPPPGEKKKDNLQDIKADREARKAELAAQADAARKENIWLALMQAGLAIAGGRSSNAVTNIGQGGQAGLASFMALEQQRRRDEDAAMRRAVAEREVQLQERRLNMMEPYYEAMTQAQQMRPIIQAQNQQRMLMVAQQNAEREATRLWQNKLKNDSQLQMMNPAQRQIEEDIFIQKTAKRLFQPEWARVSLGVPQGQRDSDNTPEE